MGVIYLVRHGQANPSAYGVADSAPTENAPADDSAAAGSDPGPGLTDTGRVQAGLTGTLLSAQISGVTAAISGDLARQTETLAGVLARLDSAPEPIVDPSWNEYELPALVGAATPDEFADQKSYQQRLDAGLAHWIDQTSMAEAEGATTPPGSGETYPEFRSRVTGAGERAAELAGSGQTVLVVSSAGTITQVIAELWGVPPHRWPAMARTMVNASVTKLLVGRSGVSVMSLNEHAHLVDREGGVATFR